MATLFKCANRSMRRTPSLPIRFPSTGFETVRPDTVLEEERFEDFKAGQYYPVRIGEVFNSRYQVLGKLGFGVTSTAWLARDLQKSRAHEHVTLKIYTRTTTNPSEFKIYKQISQGNSKHPGYPYVRKAIDIFTVLRPGGDNHQCLVQKPMWDSFKDLLLRNPNQRFTEDLLKAGLLQVFLALDYLHEECRVVHTDIKSDNILQEIEDKSILENFVKSELENPSSRKFIGGIPVYTSRKFELPKKFGRAVLADFGAAVSGDEKRNHDAQPNVYRSPEVMLKTEWSYPVDIWNVGVMIWDFFEGKHMFHGNDPDGKGYSTRAHLAEVIGMLGPPPLEMLKRGKRSHEFFDEDGRWKLDAQVPIPKDMSLERSEEFLQGKNKEMFLEFMRGMLQWKPEDRKTAGELLEDPWLND